MFTWTYKHVRLSHRGIVLLESTHGCTSEVGILVDLLFDMAIIAIPTGSFLTQQSGLSRCKRIGSMSMFAKAIAQAVTTRLDSNRRGHSISLSYSSPYGKDELLMKRRQGKIYPIDTISSYLGSHQQKSIDVTDQLPALPGIFIRSNVAFKRLHRIR